MGPSVSCCLMDCESNDENTLKLLKYEHKLTVMIENKFCNSKFVASINFFFLFNIKYKIKSFKTINI